MKKIALTFIINILLFAVSLQSYALIFSLPTNGDRVVGTLQSTTVRDGESFSDVAQRYDLGYYEVYEANPGVDPDHPQTNTALIIPTQYILPTELEENVILLNLAEMRLYYEPKGSGKVYIYPIGIGKEDWATPVGVLKIIEKTVDPKWVVPESIYKYRKSLGEDIPRVQMPGPDNPLGKYKLRLSKPTYLIHGTNEPESVGRRSSGGCIHLYNEDIDVLFHMVTVGTKVRIINSPYKVAINEGKMYLEAHMPLLEERLKLGDDVSPAINLLQAINKNNIYTVNLDKASEIAKEHLGIPLVVEN